jgi:hypothetical protein
MAAGVLSQVNLKGKIVTAGALHTVTATAEFICGQGPPGQGGHAVPASGAAGGQAAGLRAGYGVQRAGSLVGSPGPAGSCGEYRDRGISVSRSGYTWLGAVRSSRADRLVTAMVSAAARAMTVR